MKIPFQIINQIFTGRLSNASSMYHRGEVFIRMNQFDWHHIIPRAYEWIYLLGVFDNRGPIIVREEEGKNLENTLRVPSIFAITNHTLPHPDLGTEDELKTLIETIHRSRGKVMLDFIPNHTSTTHPWVTSMPHFYKRSENGGMRQEFSGDVIALDYGLEEVQSEMRSVLHYIFGLGADGVRCDMAHLIPTSFWQKAISEIRSSYPSATFLAEAYGNSVFDWTNQTQLLTAGFDAVYDEYMYRNLKSIDSYCSNTLNHLNYIIQQPFSDQLCHYLMNHDDSMPSTITQDLMVWLSLSLLLPGPVLLFQGELANRQHRLPHHYFETLDDNQSQLTALPPWYIRLRTVIKSLHPHLHTIDNQNGMIYASFTCLIGDGVLVGNITNEARVVEVNGRKSFLNILKEDTLPPHQVELLV